ncbi:uncharacterized protein LOC131553287 [Onychostoma macrolepis]|nr:uncharacterized protein LOC131553287 [Onychostoma macrolepis]
MRMSECDLYNNRPNVTVINGTLIINRVIRADSGNYTLTLSDSNGTETSRDLQVIVEAPIGSVEVSSSCFSNQTSVFCSSEGDQIFYSWTLNGKILEQGPMFGNSSIDLDEKTDGNIICSMKNHVSHKQKTIRLKPCPAAYLIALGCAALILILLFITVCYVYKKKQLKSTPAAAGDMELIYSDVSFKKKDEKKNTESLPAADVEYGAVRPQTKKEE